ncbi:MAG: hypothetical protein KCHDKBKB_00729 [Elusimicrobia bacterium]|nr:hypothetical protein [Elusimicrobiota bacterium]
MKIKCDWCEDGMITIGSEKHKKYNEYNLVDNLHTQTLGEEDK